MGRPNVGKSTLFNRLTRTRKAIVGNEAGITRDRLTQDATWDGRTFEVVDTGGIIPESRDLIPEKVFEQARIAIEESDLILFVVDVRSGPTPLDESLNPLLRASGKPYLLVVNKVDVPRVEPEVLSFYRLGVGRLFPVSAEHNEGIADLVAGILEYVPEGVEEAQPPEIRIAIVGRPNVGKSSLLNRLVGHQRVIVSEQPGTTRDSVDTVLKSRGQTFRLIDTAGIRRKGRTGEMAEKLSVVMARKSLERADVVFLVIDSVEGATKLDATIGGYAQEAGASIIIVANKWDLVEKDTFTAVERESEFRRHMRFLEYAPMIFISALTGQRVPRLLELAEAAFEARHFRISTGELNRFLREETGSMLNSPDDSRRSLLKYATQSSVAPPTFILFTRGRHRLHFSKIRFLSNRLRQRYGFFSTPIRIRQRRSRQPAGRGRKS